jgi:hypothetical protein
MILSTKENNFGIMYLNLGRIDSVLFDFRLVVVTSLIPAKLLMSFLRMFNLFISRLYRKAWEHLFYMK